MKSKKQLTRREKLKLKTKESILEFRLETKKALNTAIVAAFGFIMALAWRDVITEYISGITRISSFQGKLISAIIITLISITGILIVAKLFYVEK